MGKGYKAILILEVVLAIIFFMAKEYTIFYILIGLILFILIILRCKREIHFKIAGVYYYRFNVDELVEDSYGSNRWKPKNKKIDPSSIYDFSEIIYKDNEVKFIHEPTNLYDENAVRIDILGKTVGYVPRKINKKFLKIMDKIDFVSAKILRGELKTSIDYVTNEVFILDKNYSIRISIHYLK